MPTAVLIATARPTFDVEAAAAHADAAEALLTELGAEVHRPDGLVMAPADIGPAAVVLGSPLTSSLADSDGNGG